MSRITPGSGGPELKDDVEYSVILAEEPKREQGKSFEDGKPGDWQLRLAWKLADGSDDEPLLEWVSIRIGQKVNGEPSKLRRLLNALANKPAATPIAWFDDETFEWGYGPEPHDRLYAGVNVVIRGETMAVEGKAPKFRITTYKPAIRGAVSAPPPPPPPGGDYQYTADGKHRWKPGMADWEPVPQAAMPVVPPPPPPTPAAEDDGSEQIPF